MKKTLVAVVVVIILLAAAGGVVWWYMQRDPADTAEAFLERVAAKDYDGLEGLFTADEHPSADELKRAFSEFGEAFGLTRSPLGT